MKRMLSFRRKYPRYGSLSPNEIHSVSMYVVEVVKSTLNSLGISSLLAFINSKTFLFILSSNKRNVMVNFLCQFHLPQLYFRAKSAHALHGVVLKLVLPIVPGLARLSYPKWAAGVVRN